MGRNNNSVEVLKKQYNNTISLFLVDSSTVHFESTGIYFGGNMNGGGRHLTAVASRKEALSLYREILRTCKAFHWCDESGEQWSIRLRKEARREFEQSKEEKDPLILARLLVTGRDCVQKIQLKFNQADKAAMDRIRRDTSRK